MLPFVIASSRNEVVVWCTTKASHKENVLNGHCPKKGLTPRQGNRQIGPFLDVNFFSSYNGIIFSYYHNQQQFCTLPNHCTFWDGAVLLHSELQFTKQTEG